MQKIRNGIFSLPEKIIFFYKIQNLTKFFYTFFFNCDYLYRFFLFNLLKCLFKMSERYTIFEINVIFKIEILKNFETFRILKISEMYLALKMESKTVFSAIGIFRLFKSLRKTIVSQGIKTNFFIVLTS